MDLNSLTPEQINQIARQLSNLGDQSMPNQQHAEWSKGPAAIALEKVNAANREHMAKVGSRAHQFPQMLYRAQVNEGGKYECMKALPNDTDPRRAAAEAFNMSCCTTVNDDSEKASRLASGWVENAEDAVAVALGELKNRGQEAAERNYRDRNMSEPAKVEVLNYERMNFGHQPEIPEKPRVKRKYTKKAVTEA